MFGNNGSTSDGWMDALVERRQRLEQLNETRAIRDKHHNEMMDLISQYNELRQKYTRTCLDRDLCAAERDIAYSVLREHKEILGVSLEEIQHKIEAKREEVRNSYTQTD